MGDTDARVLNKTFGELGANFHLINPEHAAAPIDPGRAVPVLTGDAPVHFPDLHLP